MSRLAGSGTIARAYSQCQSSGQRQRSRDCTGAKDGAMNFNVYAEAVAHIAWYRDEQTCHLLFAMAELRPTEFARSTPCLRRDFRVRGVRQKRNQYLHYQRFTMTVSGVTDWTERAAQGSVVSPDDSAAAFIAGPFLEEPPWPHFVTPDATMGLPFAPDWLRSSPVHFLFPRQQVEGGVRNAIEVEANRKQLLDWLNFDLVGTYADYLGAICLLAPNPYFRSVEKAFQEPTDDGLGEAVAYKLVARHGQRLSGTRLEVINERLRGRMPPETHEFDDDAIAVIRHAASLYKEGVSITHPEHGLLYCYSPAVVVRRLRVATEVVAREKRVQVPKRGRRRPAHTHDVPELENVGDIVVGDSIDEDEVTARLVDADLQRERQNAAKAYDQHWFHRAPAEAAEWVRKTIGRARETVLIVDPYFAGRELFEFGHEIRRPKVHLRILTSVRAFGSKAERKANARSLAANLDASFVNYSNTPEIRVMTGKSPDIHDRFLAVDHDVWLSGNSLNTIGERGSVVVKLPDPASVLSHVEAIWTSAQRLSDWLLETEIGDSER